MVCKLYENLIKESVDKESDQHYEAYAQSLKRMNAIKDAKNILKRYHNHVNSKETRILLINFLGIYGNITD